MCNEFSFNINTTCSFLSCAANGHYQAGGERKRQKTVYTPHQIVELEKEFVSGSFLGNRSRRIAQALVLSEKQVKVWFQNRRVKWRKDHNLPNTKNVQRKTNSTGETTIITSKNEPMIQPPQKNPSQTQSQQQQNSYGMYSENPSGMSPGTPVYSVNEQVSHQTTPVYTKGYGQIGGSMMNTGISPLSTPYPHRAMKPEWGKRQ